MNTEAAPPLEPAGFRIVLVSFLAGAIGLIAGCIAFLLYKLIGLFTNIAFYGHFSSAFISARHNHLGLWVIPIPGNHGQVRQHLVGSILQGHSSGVLAGLPPSMWH